MLIPVSSTLELGLIYALVSLGVYLTFRIINFPDLTVDGTFPLGAAVTATMLTSGYDPVLTTFVSALVGFLAGAVTGILNVKLKIMGLLASILTMTALYSVNMRIMGSPNIALLDQNTIFQSSFSEIFIILMIVLIIYLLINYFLSSQYGLGLRASGINPVVSRSYGVNIGMTTIFTIALSNALVALAGSLFAQLQGFADVSLGTGTIIIGLASVMLGEAIFKGYKVSFALVGCFIGSILYRIAIAFALNSQILGLQPSDLNLITAALVTIAIVIPQFKQLTLRIMQKRFRANK